MQIKELNAKSLLVASKLPDADFVVNPYTGCEFACLYCYASFMGRFVNEPIEAWGEYVYVKVNAVSVLEDDLRRLSPERRNSKILLSSVTDPYHGVESKYRLTRGILKVLGEASYPGKVSILTKSPLVLRDSDILQKMSNVEVGMTVTTTDDRVSRFLEVRAPLASRRLETLSELHHRGIATYAFIGPLLPHFRYQPYLLDQLFASIAQTGVEAVYVEHMNLKGYIKKRLWEVLEDESDEVRTVYSDADSDEHRQALDLTVSELLQKHGLRLRLSEILYHNKPKDNPVA